MEVLNTPGYAPGSQGEPSNCPSTPVQRDDRIVINVGGMKHETFLSSIRSIPDTRLYWMTEKHGQCPDYDEHRHEYFFDRHPGLFVYILNFYRTGKLHCPSDVCGPLFEEELLFWGVDESVIEPCCWTNYKRHREAQVNLHAFETFEEDVQEPSIKMDLEANAGETSETGKTYNTPLKFRTSQALRNFQQKVWITLEEPNSSLIAQVVGFISMFLILLSVTNFCLETLPFFSQKSTVQHQILAYVETVCVAWFTAEFLTRFTVCPSKFDFIRSPMNWIDFGAILPFFLELSLVTNVKTIVVLRVVRLIRVFRIFKLSRHSCGLQILGHTLRSSCRELFLLFFFLSIGVVIFSSLVFYAEKDVTGTKFHSIPDAFWWSVVTMTTIGYGDVVPISWPGKCVGIMCALCGVLVIALPIPVIVSNFSLYYSHAQAKLRVSTRRKRPLFAGAAHALRVARPWGLTSPHTKYSKSEADSEITDFPFHRRSMVPSPTQSIRNQQRHAEGGRLSANLSHNHSPKLTPLSSRSPSLRPRSTSSFTTRQSTIESASKPCAYTELTNRTSNVLDDQTSPMSINQWRLQVNTSAPMEFKSPSINISPPSTPSRSPVSRVSYVLSPGMTDKLEPGHLVDDNGEPLARLDSGIETKNVSTFNGTPTSHYVPSRAGNPPRNESHSSSGTSSHCASNALSPRGRTGRRNGIFLVGFATKKWQTRAGIRQKQQDGQEAGSRVGDKSQMTGSRHSQSSDSIFATGDQGEKDFHGDEDRPPSPGISRTLMEVSKRLTDFVTVRKTDESQSLMADGNDSDDGNVTNHWLGQSGGMKEAEKQSQSPLVRQASMWLHPSADNRLDQLDSLSPPLQLLDIETAELYQRRKLRQKGDSALLSCRKQMPSVDQPDFLEGELSPIFESNSSGKCSREDPNRSQNGGPQGDYTFPQSPLSRVRSSPGQDCCGSLTGHVVSFCLQNRKLSYEPCRGYDSAPSFHQDTITITQLNRSKSLPGNAIITDDLHKSSSKASGCSKPSATKCAKGLDSGRCSTDLAQNGESTRDRMDLTRNKPCVRDIDYSANAFDLDAIAAPSPQTQPVRTTERQPQLARAFPCCNKTRAMINDWQRGEISQRCLDTTSV